MLLYYLFLVVCISAHGVCRVARGGVPGVCFYLLLFQVVYRELVSLNTKIQKKMLHLVKRRGYMEDGRVDFSICRRGSFFTLLSIW